jgi:hypothetical protein
MKSIDYAQGGISLGSKALKHLIKYSTEGATLENNVDIGVDVAFELMPMPIENAIKKSGLDDVSKKIVESELKQVVKASEIMVETTIEKKKND